MIICYKTSFLTYALAKRLVKVKYLGMPNLLMGEQIFPELLQEAATPEKIAQKAITILTTPGLRDKMTGHLHEISRRLGPPGASSRAAEEILVILTLSGAKGEDL